MQVFSLLDFNFLYIFKLFLTTEHEHEHEHIYLCSVVQHICNTRSLFEIFRDECTPAYVHIL